MMRSACVRWAITAAAAAILLILIGAEARKGSRRGADDLIGWKGEVHQITRPKRGVAPSDPPKPDGPPIGQSQWMAWHGGFSDVANDAPALERLLRKEHDAEIPPIPPAMALSSFVRAGRRARAEEAKLPSQTQSTRVFPPVGHPTEDRHVLPRYAHMATLSASPTNGSIVLAFQASAGVEGADGQTIWLAHSQRPGDPSAWWPPQPIAIESREILFRNPEGRSVATAKWGPVLHADASAGKLWLIFSESGADCHEPSGRWVVGGDIKAAATTDGETWSRPRSLYGQRVGNIPKVSP